MGAAVAFWWPLAILAALAILALLSYGIQRAGGAKVRSVPVWYCGEEHAPATVRYPASSFYLPFKHAFQGIYPAAKLSGAANAGAHSPRCSILTDGCIRPSAHTVERAADGVSRTHVGTPQIYLLWIVIGAIVVAAITLMVTR